MVLVERCASWLENKARSVHSQWGEDGLIEAVFARIGETNRWCFEVGASDGESLSNTWCLRERGWDAVLVEQNSNLYEKLRTFENERVRTCCAEIDAHTLEDILAFNGAPADIDFGVIDIDGQDYWVWSGMSRFQPRVVLIEFSPRDDGAYIPDLGTPGEGGRYQAGIEAIRDVGKDKGYVEVARTQVNLLFVKGTEL